MWIMQKYFILFLFGYFKFVFAFASKAPRNCRMPAYLACNTDDIQEDMPETEKELDIFCKQVVLGLECTIEHEKACKGHFVDIDETEKLIDLTKEVCSKNTPLYAAILENLKCAKPLIEEEYYDKCDEFPSDRQLAKHSKVLLEKGIDAFPRDEELTESCLLSLYMSACKVKEMGKCGKTAVDTFLSIHQKYDAIALEDCGDKVQKYYREIIQVLNAQD